MLFFGAGLRILQDEFALAANGSAHFDNAIDLRDLGRVFRTARFEKFGHTRQTAGDVLGLRDLPRRLREQCAGLDFLTFFHDDVRAGRNRVARDDFLLLADNDDLRMQIFLVLDDDRAHQAGRFIDVALDRHACNHVAEFDLAGLVRQNRHVVRIPLHERFALLHLGAVRLRDNRADDDIVALQLAAVGVVHADGAVLVQHDPAAVRALARCADR